MPNEAVTAPSFEEPRKSYIGDLLSISNPSIVVPDWQRSYSWKSEHTEAFWNDLLRFSNNESTPVKGEYFIGAVVLVRQKNGALLLLDGQQRLATSAILLSVLRDHIKKKSDNAARQIQEQYLAGFDYNEDKRIDKITLNTYDKDFFRRLILEMRDADYAEPQPSLASHQNILAARRRFETSLANVLNDISPENAYIKVQRLRKCLLNHFCVIQVTSFDQDNAADVFEVLNDRGIGLSTPDLLRNLVIRRANKGEEEKIVELWKPVLEFDGDTEVKNFLRHYWVSNYGDVKSQSLYREIKDSIAENPISSLAISEGLSDSAISYRQIKSADTDNKNLNYILEDLNLLPASSKALLPPLLAICETLDDQEAEACTRTLIDVFVRHTLIMQKDNSSFENVAYAAARDLRKNKSKEGFLEKIRAARQSDEDVEKAFAKISASNRSLCRYFLVKIELEIRKTEEIEVAPPQKVHIEHIYPQTPIEGQKLTAHEKLIDRLGNLTLLSARINKEIKNGPFKDKRERYKESGLEMTKQLAEIENWSKNEIDSRQNKFATFVNKIFPG